MKTTRAFGEHYSRGNGVATEIALIEARRPLMRDEVTAARKLVELLKSKFSQECIASESGWESLVRVISFADAAIENLDSKTLHQMVENMENYIGSND